MTGAVGFVEESLHLVLIFAYAINDEKLYGECRDLMNSVSKKPVIPSVERFESEYCVLHRFCRYLSRFDSHINLISETIIGI